MPKQTFFNLPEEKRRLIEKAALDEFAAAGYDNAVLNHIVETSGIAKGSFYQYFEDLKDLYFHMVDMLLVNKIQRLQPVLQHYQEHSFSHNLEELFRLGLAHSEADPKFHQLGEDFSAKPRSLVLEFMNRHKPEITDVYTNLLTHAQKEGELREDVHIPTASLFVSTLISQTTVSLMNEPDKKEQRDEIIRDLLSFINHAILRRRTIG
ncbi:MAG: TetR/AcrR family transcriptional regulator [Clostridiales bacterium]|nr:TetR/AcrR family transcriptional regulator [Clostridiales bacterium]